MISACEKSSERIDCTITVTDASTGKAISGAKVLIFETEPAAFNFDTEVTAAHAIVYTDVNGQAKAYFRARSDKEYPVLVSCANYVDSYASNGDYPKLPTGTKKTLVVKLSAEAFVKLHLKNTAPFDQNDSITVQGCSSKNFAFKGSAVDTTFLYCYDCSCRFKKNATYSQLSYQVIKNNSASTFSFGFSTHSQDTVTVNINY
ncbi:MAG: hypothetical protein ACXVP0_18645 [Bacteroidia bacterium]